MKKLFGTLSFLEIELEIETIILIHGFGKNKKRCFSQFQGNLSFKIKDRLILCIINRAKSISTRVRHTLVCHPDIDRGHQSKSNWSPEQGNIEPE